MVIRVLPLLLLTASMSVACGALVGLGAPRDLEDPPTPILTRADAAPEGDADADGPSGDDAPAVGSVEALAVGRSHACAIVAAVPSPDRATPKSVRCWGSNASGELARPPGERARSAHPLVVPHLANPTSLVLGAGTSCASTSDNSFFCWGALPAESPTGVHRDGTGSPFVPAPLAVRGAVFSVLSASLGDQGGCVIEPDPKLSLACWGNASFAPLPSDGGLTTIDGGIDLGELPFASVAIGRAHVCALSAEGATADVYCWGDNQFGQAGDPDAPTVTAPRPMGLPAFGTVRTIAAGGDTTCALVSSTADGSTTVYCWGRGDRGQLAVARQRANPAPQAVTFPTGSAPTMVVLGDAHACARMADFTVWCWGDNTKNQLGLGAGSAPYAETPARVHKNGGAQPYLNSVDSHHLAAGGDTSCALLVGDTRVWCWGDDAQGQAGQGGTASVDVATPIAW
jgi:alpha-tubulin suppressor-like RCC1 family protein